MKILFDPCVPKPLRRELPAYSIMTAAEMGWEDLRNGVLLEKSRNAFDVFLTVDRNIKREQKLSTLPIAVIVLVALKNTPDALTPLIPFVEQVLPTLRLGQMVEIDSTGVVREIAPGRSHQKP